MAPESPVRPWRRAVGFGLVVGVLVGFALVGVIAAPLFLWAQATEPGIGLQRPFVRRGLRAVPLVGLAGAVLAAGLTTRWHLRPRPAGRGGPE